MEIYRMHCSARAAGDYTGAMLAGGRWNPIGAPMFYTAAGNQLAIQVPSIVIPEEFNILLDPNHAHYHDLTWSVPLPFRFDPHLFTAELQRGSSAEAYSSVTAGSGHAGAEPQTALPRVARLSGQS
jgi:RES domain-containing protein